MGTCSGYNYLLSDFVYIMIQEIALIIEVRMTQSASSNHTIWNSSTSLHNEAKHLVIGLAGKHYASRVELEQGDRSGPQIDIEIVWQTQYWTTRRWTEDKRSRMG